MIVAVLSAGTSNGLRVPLDEATATCAWRLARSLTRFRPTRSGRSTCAATSRTEDDETTVLSYVFAD